MWELPSMCMFMWAAQSALRLRAGNRFLMKDMEVRYMVIGSDPPPPSGLNGDPGVMGCERVCGRGMTHPWTVLCEC